MRIGLLISEVMISVEYKTVTLRMNGDVSSKDLMFSTVGSVIKGVVVSSDLTKS